MISIIVCSVNPAKLAELKGNIKRTIGTGVEYEIIAVDNRRESRPITVVYNEAASKATYPYLLFIHEDAGFEQENWYARISGKLSEKSTGIIGFAGSKVMFDLPGGWGMSPNWMVMNLNQCGKILRLHAGEDKDFSEVVSLDGFAMFVRKDVWAESRFDEERLKGFHCYDVDFSLRVSLKYTNYVCMDVLPYHNSPGNFNRDWFDTTLKIYQSQWKSMLPRISKDVVLYENELVKQEEKICYNFIKLLRKKGMDDSELKHMFYRYPLSIRHIGHLLKLVKTPFHKKSNSGV